MRTLPLGEPGERHRLEAEGGDDISPYGRTLSSRELQSVPRVLKSVAEISRLKIDHRTGFLLAHVDGVQTLEEILDVCAMPPAEALSLIFGLAAMGAIELES